MATLLDRIKAVDAFPKTLDDFRVKTTSGAAVSVCALLLMLILFISQLSYVLSYRVVEKLVVDTISDSKVRVNFDITFPALSCSVVHLDAMDLSGKHQLDVDHNVVKTRLDAFGHPFGTAEVSELRNTITSAKDLLKKDTPPPAAAADSNGATDLDTMPDPKQECGSCYGAGAPDQCCNTCQEVRKLYAEKGWMFHPAGIEQCNKGEFVDAVKAEKGEGCQVQGYLEVPKVAGHFHFAPGKGFQQMQNHVHDLLQFTVSEFNVSHTINAFYIGERYPNMVMQLNGYTRVMPEGSGMFQYFLNIVPTEYHPLSGNMVDTFQYSVTDHMRRLQSQQGQGLPGVFFYYDFSAIRVVLQEERRSFTHFLTNCCAIIGGVFTVMGVIDALVHRLLARFSPDHLKM